MKLTNEIKLNSRRKKELIDKIVSECREKARQIVANWEPVDSAWPVVDGCAYLRLSTDDQVAVEKGSLEQQINIAVSEAVARSQADKKNYRITKFFIEPGITGTTDKRPEFRLLLSEVKSSKHRFIIMKELARITRETNVWKDFFNLCIQSDCQIFIRNFPFNPNDPAQIFQLDILAAFAQYESNQTSRRVRESVYSAMVTSGKFNSTHRVLGLKQLVVNGEPQVGFYVPDQDELKTVTWAMETFVKYASYSKTLDECERLGVVNWNGSSFKTHALVNLLTNKRYIGEWELNIENKDKDQSRLMPYDRYTKIELPHGCLIDKELWNRVQATIEDIKGRKDKNLNINRVYPLSGGLLLFKDGSRFSGGSAWKEDRRHTYYHNRQNDIRLVAETIEEEARRIASEIVRDSKMLQDSIARYGKDRMAASDLYFTQVEKMKRELATFEDEKKRLNRRLDVIIDGASNEEIQKFKVEYKTELEKCNAAIKGKQLQITDATTKAETLRRDEFNWKELGKRCEAVLTAIQEKDPIALKNAYRHLFEAIVVGDIGPDGKTGLKFVLKGQNVVDFLDFVNERNKSRNEIKLAQVSQDIPQEFPPPKPLVISSINTVPLVRQESFLRQKYEVEGLSIRQIAALTFSARSTVAAQMKAFEIPLRNCAQQLQFNKGQMAYGERHTQMGIIEHKGQGDVIGLMVRLRAKDYSYWKIAEELTRRGIPTKNGKEAWKAATVMKICKRASKHYQ